jgi:general secretion pathway protein A
MYEKFYGFKEKPFSVTPDTKFFFPSEKHKEALDSLIYTIKERKGFAVVTGEIGSGKTTVWHTLLRHLDGETKLALITNTHLTPKQMIMAVLEDLEIPFKENWTKVKLLFALNNYLLEQASLGCNVVLVIDEAQNLNSSALEEVRMLSNLETEKEKLIQIILMGQPELRHKLALAGLTQLRQRIVVYYHLYPLSKEETKDYIAHRLKICGANGNAVFGDSALEKIYSYCEGVPRKINIVCDRALLTGFINERLKIESDIIDEVIKEIEDIIISNQGFPAESKNLPSAQAGASSGKPEKNLEVSAQETARYATAEGTPEYSQKANPIILRDSGKLSKNTINQPKKDSGGVERYYLKKLDWDANLSKEPLEYIKGYPEGLLNNGG